MEKVHRDTIVPLSVRVGQGLPELMKPIRAFAAIDMSKSRGYEGIQKGEIPHIKIAGQIRIPRSWVEDCIRKALTSTTDPDSDAR